MEKAGGLSGLRVVTPEAMPAVLGGGEGMAGAPQGKTNTL